MIMLQLQGPAFLLFLDCTWQLLQQFPSAFEFTEIYLTALWDSVTLGIFSNFLHSTSHKLDHSKHVLSVWNWENQFDEDTVALFYNPLYHTNADSSGSEGHCWTFPRYLSKPVGCTRPVEHSTSASLSSSVLWPRHHMPDLHVWSLCYLRWLTPVQIVHGGSPAELIAQRSLLDDIHTLQEYIVRLSEEQTVSAQRPSQLQQHDTSVVTILQHVSSSYPFADCHPSHQTTLTGYYAASSLQLSCSEDSISVDELSVTDVSNSELYCP